MPKASVEFEITYRELAGIKQIFKGMTHIDFINITTKRGGVFTLTYPQCERFIKDLSLDIKLRSKRLKEEIYG